MQVEPVPVSAVEVGARHRATDADKVIEIAQSIEAVGLLQAITVFTSDNDHVYLVAGLHRLEAAKLLGWDFIDAVYLIGGDADREMAEIAENLHRAELTALERDEQVARWIELVEQRKAVEAVSVQPAPKLEPRPVGRPESGISAASRELGIEATDAKRAVKVASLAPEAKEAARDLGLDDNRTALLEAAKAPTAEAQVAALARRKTVRLPKGDDIQEVARIIALGMRDAKSIGRLDAALIQWGTPDARRLRDRIAEVRNAEAAV